MPAQQILQYSSGKARPGLSQYQSRGSQVPTPYQSSWSSRANTATGQAGTQGSWYANSSSRPLSATSPAANSQYGNMGSWSQGNTEQASSQGFNQYLDSVMSTKTPTGTQSRQQVQPGPLPWDTRWMPDRSQAGVYSKSSTGK
ncbi:hypothetical protein CKM354_000022600 [Cercospora kikuchii]|uniref:Uncharacterized protein n=1 Tax=Cercospora kikuchii TaxID=84275 RepID=A0A9P3C3H6_9PEZI|nr:uncharacterized protein CKM354_000022600 [Cercospora kikuchii]GIZ36759.1 hypothetical protein CKM354_000022600 [Cercospora kikuchii]